VSLDLLPSVIGMRRAYEELSTSSQLEGSKFFATCLLLTQAGVRRPATARSRRLEVGRWRSERAPSFRGSSAPSGRVMDQFEFWRWPDEQTPLRRAGGPSSTTTRVLSEGPFATTRQTRQPFRPSSFRRRSQILHLAAVELLDLVGVGRRGWIRHLRVRTASGGQNSRKDGNCKKHHDTDQLPLHTSSLKTPRTDCAAPCCTVSYAGRLVRSNYRRRYQAGRLLWSSVREYVAESSWNATGLGVLNPRQVSGSCGPRR